jgi:hypothetical protein
MGMYEYVCEDPHLRHTLQNRRVLATSISSLGIISDTCVSVRMCERMCVCASVSVRMCDGAVTETHKTECACTI